MAKFIYKAFDETGTEVTGELDADSADAANNILLGRGYIPSQVTEGKRTSGSGGTLAERLAKGQIAGTHPVH